MAISVPSPNVNVFWVNALGASDVFLHFQEHLAQITDSERPILILGERGTGKELAAQRIHYMSRRWDKAFVTLLCTALSPNLLEAELFGYEAGAFTGARERHKGYFEQADQGTLFLDEVADMPLPLQDKLLRVLEYGMINRVGSTQSLRVDVRVVAATNKDVVRLAEEGLFRADLLDRLACEVVHVPPLRERGEDITLLARHFANRLVVELGEQVFSGLPEDARFGPEALRQMEMYRWPGNVRELKNVVERSVLRARSTEVHYLILDPFIPPWVDVQTQQDPLPVMENQEESLKIPHDFDIVAAIDDVERRSVQAALVQARYRQTEAAKLLGLSYHQFRALYKRLRAAYPEDFN